MVAQAKSLKAVAVSVLICAGDAAALDPAPDCSARENFEARYACVEAAVIASTRGVDDAFARADASEAGNRDAWHTQTLRHCADTIAGMTSQSADILFGLCVIERNNAKAADLINRL